MPAKYAKPMPEFVPITDSKNLIRHTDSMAVVNTDSAARARYRANRERIIADQTALKVANEQIDNLRQDVQQLKELVNKYIVVTSKKEE
jgi:hypothetical protein